LDEGPIDIAYYCNINMDIYMYIYNLDGEGTSCVVIIVKCLERELQKIHTEVLRRGVFGSNNMRGQEKNLLTGG
jgi:hypothetical protein